MALAALANIAAATAAGWTETVLDRGASFVPAAFRFEVTLELQAVGAANENPVYLRAVGQGANQAAAETVALNACNAQRLVRYGADTGTVSVSPKGGGAHTRDKT